MRQLVLLGFAVLSVAADGELSQACVLDVGFILDGSGSVLLDNWLLMLSFVKEFVHDIDFSQKGTRIGVVSYGNHATLNIKLNQFNSIDAFAKALQDIPYKDENTNTAAGLRILRTELFNEENGDRPDIQNVAVLLSDGISTWEANNTIPEAKLLKEAGVKVFAIGIGPEMNADELKEIASAPGRPYVYVAKQFSDLITLHKHIVNSTCLLQGGISEDVVAEPLEPSTTTTAATKTTTVTTTTTPKTTTTRSRRTRIDVAFLLDSSGSITYGDWVLIKEFLKRTVRSIDLALHEVRVAVIEYSSKAVLSVPLGNFTNYKYFDADIDRMPHLDQRTNISGAIRLAYREVFSTKSARTDAKKVIVLITDGQSNTDDQLIDYEVDTAKSLDIAIFTVGVGGEISINHLKRLSSKPYYYFIQIFRDFSNLVDSWNQVANALFSDNYPEEKFIPRFHECTGSVMFIVDVSPWESDAVHGTVKSISDALSSVGNSNYGSWITSTSSRSDNIRNVDLTKSLRNAFDTIWTHIGDDSYKRQDIVVIVSSRRYDDTTSLQQEVRNLKSRGITFMVMAIGSAAEDRFLQEIASEPKDKSFVKISDSAELEKEFNRYRSRGSTRLYPVIANTCKMSALLEWSCSFEGADKCQMEDDDQMEFSWSITNGATPSRHTGPESAYNGQYYAFLEASSPRRYGDRAGLYLPFPGDGVFCLSFYYHMFGFHIGILDVIVLANGQEHILWRMAGQKGTEWLFAEVLLQLHTGNKIEIRGIRGEEFSGDIALDLIRIRRGPCVGDA